MTARGWLRIAVAVVNLLARPACWVLDRADAKPCAWANETDQEDS